MGVLLDLSPQEWTAVWLSLRVATVAMLASLPVGIAVAYLLARGRFPGKALLNGIVLLPLILPPVVSALPGKRPRRSEEHTSELQSLRHLVCRLLLEKKKKNNIQRTQR